MSQHRIEAPTLTLSLLCTFLLSACGTELPLPELASAQPQESPLVTTPATPATPATPDESVDSEETQTPSSPDSSGDLQPSESSQEAEPSEPVEKPAQALPTPSELPLASIEDLVHVGGFRLPAKEYNNTSMNYAKGVIEQSNNTLFIVGHRHHDMIAEFAIPELVNSEDINDLVIADDPIQTPVSVLGAARSGNPQAMDEITGLELINNHLVINAMEYYDAPADNTHTTLIAQTAISLAHADITGYYELDGAAHAGGWLSPVPQEWQADVGSDYLAGHSSGEPIISRHSVGPSAFAVKSDDLLNASSGNRRIETQALLDFSLENPLNEDLFNESRSNDLWTHTSNAVYGFIIPGTRTYATFGYTSGQTSGIGYKITQDTGDVCPGHCSYVKSDESNYYWFWDMDDLLAVKQGEREAYSVKPYAYGPFDTPYQTSESVNRLGGASFNSETNTLMFSVLKADNTQGEYANPPVIAVYELTTK